MKFSLLNCFVIIGLLSIAPQVNAAIILEDNFNRPDGSLTGSVPTPGPGGVWTRHSGTEGDLLIVSGQAEIQHGVPSEDTHSMFGAVTTGTLTANFDITVNDDTPITAGDSEYFAHFMSEGSFNFISRMYVVPANDVNNDYTFGLSTGSGGFTEILPTDFSFGEQINGTLTYDFASGFSSFTVGGTTITSSVQIFETSLDSFALRQSDSSNNETISVDNLVVSTGVAIPEPGSFAVLSLIGLAGLAQRRRK